MPATRSLAIRTLRVPTPYLPNTVRLYEVSDHARRVVGTVTKFARDRFEARAAVSAAYVGTFPTRFDAAAALCDAADQEARP